MLIVGLAAVILAVPSTILAVRELSGDAQTVAERVGADGQQVVAVVNGDPIPRAAYDHWLGVARADEKGGSESKHRHETMDFLITNAWVDLEARERGVTVTQKAIDKELEEAKQTQFPSEHQYQVFLKTTRQTEDDLKLRVRIKLLTEKLQPNLQSEAGDLTLMQEEFYLKWRPKTICASGFVTEDCGNR